MDSSIASHFFVFFSFQKAIIIEQQTNGEVFLICEKNLQKRISLCTINTNLTRPLPTIMPAIHIGNAESCSHRTGGSDTIRNRYSPSSITVAHNQLTLHAGAQRSWNHLIDGKCGIVSLRDIGAEFQQQQCQVAGLVPKGRKENGGWNVDDWLDRTVSLYSARKESF